MRKNNKTKKKLKYNDRKTKFYIFLAFLILIFLYYVVNLFNLQILDTKGYKFKGNNISKLGGEIVPERGNIFDSNHRPLAISKDIRSLYILPVVSKNLNDEAYNIVNNKEKFDKLSEVDRNKYKNILSREVYNPKDITQIAKILDIDESEIYKFIDRGREGYIYKELTKFQEEQLKVLDLRYLLFYDRKDRYYPYKDMLSNTIGFVDEEGIVNGGLELYYNDIISGKKGYEEYFKALHGTKILYTKSEHISPEKAKNIVTTLNVDLQKIVSKRLKETFYKSKSMNAIGLITNPNDGSIIALESLPSFDANNPRNLNSETDKIFLSKLKVDQVSDYLVGRWRNNAVSMIYDPGSVYKIITTAVALETGDEIKKKIYDDNGFVNVDGVIIKSWRYWNPHGLQTLKEGLKNSSNPVFVKVAQDIGKERYFEYSKAYKLGNYSGIDLPNEEKGFYPKDANISNVNFAVMSYGHYINVNAIQFVSAVNSTINGGKYYKPHLLKEVVDKNNNVVYKYNREYTSKTVSEETSKELREYLKYVADSYGFNENGIKAGIKTGSTVKYTSNSIFKDPKEIEESKNNETNLVLSLYVIYPADNPKYSLYLVFDEPVGYYSSTELTFDVAKNIINDIREYESKNENNTTIIKGNIKIPNFKGLTLEDALSVAKKNNLELTSKSQIGRYHIIDSQNYKAGDYIQANSKIEVTSNGNIKMPYIIGKNINDVKELFNKNKIKYKVQGKGNIVSKQSIKADTIYKQDKELIITIEER